MLRDLKRSSDRYMERASCHGPNFMANGAACEQHMTSVEHNADLNLLMAAVQPHQISGLEVNRAEAVQ